MLNGRNVLIVEAEFLIALDIQRMLEPLDVGQCLLARNAAEARRMQAQWPDLALAVIEIRVDDANARQLAHDLAAMDLPLVAITGDIHLPRAVNGRNLPVVVKPIPEQELASAVVQALAEQR